MFSDDEDGIERILEEIKAKMIKKDVGGIYKGKMVNTLSGKEIRITERVENSDYSSDVDVGEEVEVDLGECGNVLGRVFAIIIIEDVGTFVELIINPEDKTGHTRLSVTEDWVVEA